MGGDGADLILERSTYLRLVMLIIDRFDFLIQLMDRPDYNVVHGKGNISQVE